MGDNLQNKKNPVAKETLQKNIYNLGLSPTNTFFTIEEASGNFSRGHPIPPSPLASLHHSTQGGTTCQN